MKIKYVLNTAIIFCICVVSHAQVINFSWAKSFGGGTSNGFGQSVATDTSGNVYSVGFFANTTDFDPGPGIYNLTPNGSFDIFISKLGPAGNFIWAKRIGGPGDDRAYSIAVDKLGNCFVTGFFNQTVDFDPNSGFYNLTSAGGRDAFILKLNTTGNFVWANKFGDTGADGAISLAIDTSCNVYTTGDFRGTVDFDPGPAVFTLSVSSGPGSEGCFISKLDSSGVFIWAKRLAINGTQSKSIAVDISGNVYTTGQLFNTNDFDPSVAIFNLTSAGGLDIFVCKLDVLGNFVWAKRMGDIYDDYGLSIVVDSIGNVLTTGSYDGTVDFDPGTTIYNLTTTGGLYEVFVSKLNASGTFVWAKSMGGLGKDEGKSIALDKYGNVFVAGTYSIVADFDPGPSTYSLSSQGLSDIFLSKLDQSGNFIWAKTLGGQNTDEAFSIHVNSNNDVFTTGFFYGSGDFDPGPAVFNLTTTPNYQAVFVQKLSQCFAPLPPSNATNPANLNICSMGTATLNAISSGTVNWFASSSSSTILNSGTVFVTPPLSAGVYTYYTETEGCTISLSRTAITLTVNALPTISVSGTLSAICLGQSVTLNASGASSYTWISFNAGNAITVSPSITTTYSVVGLDVNGCSNTISVTQLVDPCTGLGFISSIGEDLNIYPNPSNGLLILELPQDAQAKIVDIYGKIVYDSFLNAGSVSIKVVGLENGVYLIKISMSGKEFVKKVVIDK